MSLKSIAQGILGVVAPTLGTAFGGPLGGMAGAWLSGKLGIKEGDLPNFLSNMTPEEMARVKILDQEFDLKMKEMDVDIFEIEIDDRKDARSMAKENMKPQIILSAMFIIGYFAIVGMLMGGVVSIPETFKEGTILLLGILTREVPTVMQFWFGSSHGSKKKVSPYDTNQ